MVKESDTSPGSVVAESDGLARHENKEDKEIEQYLSEGKTFHIYLSNEKKELISHFETKLDDIHNDVKTELRNIKKIPVHIRDVVEVFPADINCTDAEGKTPLHNAVCKKQFQVVEYLLKQDSINVNKKDKHGKTPLHYSHADEEMVDLLLKFDKLNIEWSQQDGDGKTFLHNYCEVEHCSCIVIQNVVDKCACHGNYASSVITIKDNNGKTPFVYAHQRGFYECLNILSTEENQDWKKKDGELREKLKQAIVIGDFKELDQMLESIEYVGHVISRSVKENNAEMDSILHFAISRFKDDPKQNKIRDVDMLKKLSSVDGITLQGNKHGQTPLHLACIYQPDIVKILLPHCSDINETCEQGKSALHYAAEGKPKTLRLLLNEKIQDIILQSKDNNGKTALDYLYDGKKWGVLKDLIKHLKEVKDLSIDQLLEEDIKNLANSLDISTVKDKPWKSFHREVSKWHAVSLEEFQLRKISRDCLFSLGEMVVQNMHVRGVTVNQFQDIAKKMKREDIVSILDGHKGKKIEDIEDKDKEMLMVYIGMRLEGCSHDWKQICEHLMPNSVMEIERVLYNMRVNSPTRQLIEIYRQHLPDITLMEMHQYLLKIGFKKTALILIKRLYQLGREELKKLSCNNEN